MGDIVKHNGIIESIEGTHIRVKIVQASACTACKAVDLCKTADSKEKLVDVFDKNATDFFPGEQVFLYGTTRKGMQAVLLSFGLPFLVMVIVLFIAISITGDEGVSALIALLSLIPYYIVLCFFKKKLSKRFSFTLEKSK